MQKANYLNTRTTSGGSGKYPLSTQTLDFIQGQIMLLQGLGMIGGSRYILSLPDGEKTGLVFIDGELLTLSAKPVLTASIKFVNVTTSKENINADGETYTEARVYRTAALSASAGAENYPIDKFSQLVSNQTLAEQVKQVPQVVLTYLEDVLAEKMPLLHKSGLTKAQIDALTVPCVITCTNSIAIAGHTNYSLSVTNTGNGVVQTVTLSDGSMLERVRLSSGWPDGWVWKRTDRENFKIEVKLVRDAVYIRHSELPAGTKIILVRKKRRSAWRRTGGDRAYTQNRGIRLSRSPKRGWVNYKGIVLGAGNPNEWYIPRCVDVGNPAVDGDLLGKEMGGLCRGLITQLPNDADGYSRYRVAGLRKLVTRAKRSAKTKSSGYVEIGIQAVRTDGDKSRMVGGEVARLKYRIQTYKSKQKMFSILGFYKHVFYRSFSLG